MMGVASVLMNTGGNRWGATSHSDELTSEETAAIEATMDSLYPLPVSPYFNGWYFSKGDGSWYAKKLSWDGGIQGLTLADVLREITDYERG